MVSLFTHKVGVVLGAQSIENKKENEGQAARELISKFSEKGIIFTMDALHCQKKHSVISWSQEMTM